jgi:hypothetical protein
MRGRDHLPLCFALVYGDIIRRYRRERGTGLAFQCLAFAPTGKGINRYIVGAGGPHHATRFQASRSSLLYRDDIRTA